ncbi:MAG: helix-turn-helix domain-containing protein [Prevotellaceae bacterium]|nr:helix-turn-helix domain-containing protein [Prevotellaceae bacterium]
MSRVQVIKYDNICLVKIDPPKREEVKVEPVSEKHKPQKGDSAKVTLEMFDQGQAIAQIAAARNISESTVESHLGQMVASGDLDIHKWLSKERISAIEEGIKKVADKNLTQIFSTLSHEYSYGEIRGVLAHQQAKSTPKKE